jgi:hypothetical protein
VIFKKLKAISNLARSTHKPALVQLKSVLETTKVEDWVETVTAHTERENKVA